MRLCGECTYCCKVLGVKELDKPAGRWCQHCTIGKGCQIYADRPQSCRDFRCVWLQKEDMDAELRPDKCRVVLSLPEDSNGLYVHIEEHRPDAWRAGRIGDIIAGVRWAGADVVILEGENGKRLLPGRQLAIRKE